MIITTRYEVVETNADLEHIRLIHSGYSRDIAESKALKQFQDAEFERDYIVVNRNTQEIIGACFTPKTLRLRNECQG